MERPAAEVTNCSVGDGDDDIDAPIAVKRPRSVPSGSQGDMRERMKALNATMDNHDVKLARQETLLQRLLTGQRELKQIGESVILLISSFPAYQPIKGWVYDRPHDLFTGNSWSDVAPYLSVFNDQPGRFEEFYTLLTMEEKGIVPRDDCQKTCSDKDGGRKEQESMREQMEIMELQKAVSDVERIVKENELRIRHNDLAIQQRTHSLKELGIAVTNLMIIFVLEY